MIELLVEIHTDTDMFFSWGKRVGVFYDVVVSITPPPVALNCTFWLKMNDSLSVWTQGDRIGNSSTSHVLFIQKRSILTWNWKKILENSQPWQWVHVYVHILFIYNESGTWDHEGASRRADAVADFTLVRAVVGGIEYEAELWDVLRVHGRSADRNRVPIPTCAGYTVRIGLENYAAQNDRLVVWRADILEDGIHHGRVWEEEKKKNVWKPFTTTMKYSVLTVKLTEKASRLN